MSNDSKERMTFEAAQVAIDASQRGQNHSEKPYQLYALTSKLSFGIVSLPGGIKFVPGLRYDPFQVGPAMATRDALNAAYAAGRAAARPQVNLAEDSSELELSPGIEDAL